MKPQTIAIVLAVAVAVIVTVYFITRPPAPVAPVPGSGGNGGTDFGALGAGLGAAAGSLIALGIAEATRGNTQTAGAER